MTPLIVVAPTIPYYSGMKRDWYRFLVADVVAALGSDTLRGLTSVEAARRLSTHGFNELVEKGLRRPGVILWEQFTATMVVILIMAALISLALKDYKDAVAIIVIVLLNALLGFIQEFKAEKALAALKKMAVPRVKVRRDGHVIEISSRELVPGDIVLLEAGNRVPADGRLVESSNVRVQESALTGESEPVEKSCEPLAEERASVADRCNMVYLGTVVMQGRGEAVVTETGMQTELGHIARLIEREAQASTPLQKRLDQLGRRLAWVSVGIVGVVFMLGLLRGEDIRTLFLTAVSMAVAAIPEGLPAVVTIALALGAQRMLKRCALIRKLPAVETLGSVTVICTDKTGTLTQNRMTVTVWDVAGYRADLEQGFPTAEMVRHQSGLALLLTGSTLCNDATLEGAGDDLHMIGDPTEGALLVASARTGMEKNRLNRVLPRVAEIPFDSHRKRMTTVHRSPAQALDEMDRLDFGGTWVGASSYLVFTKGAVDGLLPLCTHLWIDDRPEPMDERERKRIAAVQQELAQKGMRVLGVCFRPLDDLSACGDGTALESHFIFVGIVGMMDPARPEVKEAVEKCQAAGIRPVMITGDHPLTAHHIASQLGIASDDRVMTGRELEGLSMAELERLVESVSVYARVSPEHKLKLVDALQHRGHNVAMTGDGVNDAPALKKADIGVAMGQMGADVSKEAADMVLLDDNFATIVAAIEEGRVIYDNIRKFLKYLLTTNSAELMVMLLAPFLGMPLPLLPLQILWINLVTDGPTALTLGLEAPETNVMRRRPYPPSESLFGRGLGRHAVWVGALMTGLSLGVGAWYWHAGHEHWQTMVFTTLAFSQMGHVLAIRSERESVFSRGFFSNKWLLGAVAATVLSQLAVVYAPFLQGLFKTKPLSGWDLGLTLLFSGILLLSVEGEKWFLRRRVP